MASGESVRIVGMNSALMKGVVGAIQDGVQDLRAALEIYWPSPSKKADNTEDSLTYYVARSLQEKGFYIYFQAPMYGQQRKHIDCLALQDRERMCIAIESKRLFNSEKMKEVYLDYQRVQDFNLNKGGIDNVNHFEKYGMILAMTWRQHIAEWWMSKSASMPVPQYYKKPKINGKSPWVSMLTDWPKNECAYGALKVYDDDDDKAHVLFLLFAI